MGYVKPDLVTSPKGRISDLEVIYDGGEGSWSLARMKWDGEESVGLRWNGGSDDHIGNPQSRGVPTWFILPDEIARVVIDIIRLHNEISS